MKEMVGGCCVCGDENGWQQNPLVYCDGANCEVAVHQGCYGILKVPDDSWYCAKCSANVGLGTSNVRCELCPFGHGALKRTDKGGWAHVICALYIPEVQFGDVNSMDPVVLSSVPQEKFNRSCYLCEESREPGCASLGACMQCNKTGCKKYFHVTCAQHRGHLCEETGGAGKGGGVKYVGYCSTHAKKAHNDPLIKIVPPYRPVIASTSSGGGSGHSTPDPGLLMTSSAKERRRNGPTNAKDYAPTNSNHLVNCVPTPVCTPNSVSSSSTSARHLNGPEPSPPPSTSVQAPPPAPTTLSMTVSSAPPMPVVVASSALPATYNLASAVGVGGPPKVPSQALRKRGRPPGSGRSNDGEERPKRPRKNVTKRTVKTLLELVNPVVQDTVSDFQRERVQQGVASTGVELLSVVGGAPLPPACSLPGLGQLPATSLIDAPLPGIAALAENYTPTGVPLKPTPKLGLLSPDSQNMAISAQRTFPTSLEQLLERQWEQGRQFLMEQAQHFDIASLLSCLHQLKLENTRLEETIVSLAGRRDHLLAVNARLSLALGQNLPQSSPHVSPRVNAPTAQSMPDSSLESSPGSALSQLRHMATTTSVSPASQVSSQAKSAQTQASSSTSMVSPRSASGSAPSGGYANVGSSSGVFTSVSSRQMNKTDTQSPPERTPAFLMPRTPTPLIASSGTATTLAALQGHYPMAQDQMIQQLVMQQQAAAYAAAGLVPQATSPQRGTQITKS